MGFDPNEWKTEGVGEGKNGVLPKKEVRISENPPSEIIKQKPQPSEKVKKDTPQDKLIQATVYLTKYQQKALKLKVATSDRVEDKDQSAIVRTALDVYLADIIKNKLIR